MFINTKFVNKLILYWWIKKLINTISFLCLIGFICNASAQKKREIRLGLPVVVINSSYCMFAVAIKQGYFSAEGLDVKINNIAGSTSVVQTLLGGRLDIGAATPEPVFKAYSQGEKVIFIYNFVRKPTGSVAVFTNSPIKTIADLKGKKLGAQGLGSGNIMLTNALLHNVGIDGKKEVKYLSVGVGSQALLALESGHVDALILFDTLYAQIEGLGAKLRYIQGDGQEDLFSTQFFINSDNIEKDYLVYIGFGRAMAKASIFAKINPEACVRMLWQEYPSIRISGIPESEQLKSDVAILNKRIELMLPLEELGKGWGHYDSKSISAWNNFAFEGGIIDKKIERINGIYDNRFVSGFNNFDKNSIIEISKQIQK